MDRNKLIGILVGTLVLGGVVAYGVGTAQAATWHDYKGDIFAGHAYGLQVPANANAYEVTLTGDETAAAKLAFFDPAGVKLGYYELSKDLTSASVVAPIAGRHMLYVYDLTGALNLRVDADSAPAALELAKVALKRADVDIGAQDSPAKFDKVLTANVPDAPVFITLLYEGSAKDLDATVASNKGDVVTITDENGAAFSPGVWTSVSGTRTSAPGNIEGTAYTVTVHAASFEGRLVLTTLSLDLKAPLLPADTPARRAHEHVHAPTAVAPTPEPIFALPVGKAIAFDALAGELLLTPARGAEADVNARQRHEDEYTFSTISLYAPDDSLLAFVTIDSRHRNATIELPTDGEYVAYVHEATNKAVIAQLAGSAAPPATRILELAEETMELDADSGLLFGDEGAPFALEHVPVAMQLKIDEDAFSLLGGATITNEHGLVADASTIANAPGADWLSWSYQNPENFAAGEHTLRTSGILEGKLTLTSLHFLRDSEAPVTAEAAPPAPPAEPREPPAPPVPPAPPEVPLSAVPLADAVLGLLG